MKTTLRIALMASSIASISPAIAGEGGGAVANTFFTSLPGVIAQAPLPTLSPHAVAANQGNATAAYVTSSRSAASLFSNHYEGGANN